MTSSEKKGRPKILVVDDEKEITDFLSDFFREREFVARALNASADILSTYIAFRPNIVLLDVNLGSQVTLGDGTQVYDGIAALEKIKSVDSSAKVIIVTGVDHQEIIDQAKARGAVDFITKPLNLEYLETTVTEKIRELLSSTTEASE